MLKCINMHWKRQVVLLKPKKIHANSTTLMMFGTEPIELCLQCIPEITTVTIESCHMKRPQSLWCFYSSAGLDILSLMPSTCVCIAYQWQFFTHNHQNKNSSRIQKALQSQKICNHRDHLFWVICNITINQLITALQVLF